MKWFRNHPSLIQIKQIVSNQAKSFFQSVSVHTVKEVMVASSSHKLIAGEILIKVLKERGFTFEYLTCVNKMFLSGKFPDSLNCQMQCNTTFCGTTVCPQEKRPDWQI